MEINATNEARSTENTTKNQTTFRLGLHLSTAHGDPASDTYADFNFAGSTPDEFDHALATILDVVTSTVYGGQLNGLREQCSDDLAQSDHAAGVEAHRYDEKVHSQRVEECCENRDQDARPFVLQRFVQHSSCPHFSPH